MSFSDAGGLSRLRDHLNDLFGDSGYTLTGCESIQVLVTRRMGFSGAVCLDLKCTWTWAHASTTEAKEQHQAPPPPSSLFVKDILIAPPNADAAEGVTLKYLKDLQSYRNEKLFQEQCAPRLRANGINIPTTYQPILSSVSPEGVSRFVSVSESMRGRAEQVAQVDKHQFRSGLKLLAQLHAFYQGEYSPDSSSLLLEVDKDVPSNNIWREGTHNSLRKRPANETDKIPRVWQKFCADFGLDQYGDVGAKLAELSPAVAEKLFPADDAHKAMERRRFTVVHGDFKPGNLFFAPNPSQPSAPIAHLIDFQWSGFGNGATDLIYFMATAVNDDLIDEVKDVQQAVLRPYYSFLSEAKRGLDYTYDELVYDFQLATLDYLRYVFSYRLVAETPEKYAERRANVNPNVGAYKRSEKLMALLIGFAAEYVPIVTEKLGGSRL